MRRLALLAALGAGALLAPAASAATRECDGLDVCVPVAGPWVVLPAKTTFPRPQAAWQVTCPRGHVAGGLDAQLTERAIDLGFLGRIGAPVNPGISTARSVLFLGRYVGATAAAPAFKPRVGCMPSAGGGERIPTAAAAIFRPGQPTVRRVTTRSIRPGRRIVSASCRAGETLVDASFAFAFRTARPPTRSVVRGVTGRRAVSGRRVAVTVRADAEVSGARAAVQVHALCSRLR